MVSFYLFEESSKKSRVSSFTRSVSFQKLVVSLPLHERNTSPFFFRVLEQVFLRRDTQCPFPNCSLFEGIKGVSVPSKGDLRAAKKIRGIPLLVQVSLRRDTFRIFLFFYLFEGIKGYAQRKKRDTGFLQKLVVSLPLHERDTYFFGCWNKYPFEETRSVPFLAVSVLFFRKDKGGKCPFKGILTRSKKDTGVKTKKGHVVSLFLQLMSLLFEKIPCPFEGRLTRSKMQVFCLPLHVSLFLLEQKRDTKRRIFCSQCPFFSKKSRVPSFTPIKMQSTIYPFFCRYKEGIQAATKGIRTIL